MEPVVFWNLILTLFLSVGGWFIRSTVSDMRRLEQKMFECQSDLSDKYVRKDDYREDIRRIEHKLDQIFEVIADVQRFKADK
jgi:cob(I)alamin adenosyltransferase